MRYTAEQRRKILREARETLARLRMAECIDGLREERNSEGDRRLRAIERRHRNQPLIYKTKLNARIF
jgi:hypothetical protein